MTTVHVQGAALDVRVIDLTPPWVGRPETVLFHHGLGASSGIWWAWTPLLADRYRLVHFDMRAHGRSSRPRADGSVTLDRLVADLFSVADGAGAQRFHLVGESIGGTVALAAAIARPNRIASVTVCNGAHAGGSIRSIDGWRSLIESQGMDAWSAHMMHCRFFDGGLPPALWRWYEREQAAVDPGFLLEAAAMLAATDLSPRLGEVRQPAMLMHGDSSPFIPVAVMADLRSRLADARLRVFPHARHGLPFSHAAECAAVLRAFLDDLPPTPPAPRYV